MITTLQKALVPARAFFFCPAPLFYHTSPTQESPNNDHPKSSKAKNKAKPWF